MKWLLGVSMIAIALALGATAPIPVAAVSVDDVSLKFLPPDTEGIAFFDVAGLRDSPLAQEELKNGALGLPRGLMEFQSATGFDLQRDIDKVTLGKLGAKDGLVIVQGRLDKFKIEQYLKDKGKESEVYLGQTLFHDGDSGILVLNNVAVIGPLAAVKRAIDQMQLPGSSPLRSDLMAAIQTIEPGNQMWGVGSFSMNDLRAAGIRGPAPAVDMLKALESGTYQVRLDTGIHAQMTGKFSDADSARNVGDMARGFISLARVQVSRQQPDLARLLDGIQISNTATTLTMKVEESGELLKKLKPVYGPTIERQFQ